MARGTASGRAESGRRAPQRIATPSGSRAVATTGTTYSNPNATSENDDDASFFSESAPDNDDSDNDDFAPHMGARGKRKRADGSKSSKSSKSAASAGAAAGKKPPRKKAKGKAKEEHLILNLSNLSEVTFDILHEIFSYLSPLDLLNIALSNKANKAFLYSPECKSIWKAARRNFPGFPECPDDMTEPQYAYLAFGKECFKCGKTAPKKLYTVWTARKRLCSTCLNKNFESAYLYGQPRYSHHQDIAPLLKFLPTITISNSGIYSCYETAHRWTSKRYSPNVDIKAWVKTMVAKWSVINEHAKACEIWEQQCLDVVKETKKNTFDARVDAILDRLETTGWQAEVQDIRTANEPERRREFSQQPLIRKICQKDITQRIFQNQSPALAAFMEKYREDMRLRMREELLKARIPYLNNVIKAYTATAPPNEVSPAVSDFFAHKDVRDFVINTPSITSAADFAPLLERLPAIAQEIVKLMTEKLRRMVATTGGEFAADPAIVLELATTTFRCPDCESGNRQEAGLMRYPRVLAHHHALKWHYQRPVEDDDMKILRQVTGVVPWNQSQIIEFDTSAAVALKSVIKLCGLDPKTTTKEKMDELDPIVECLTCNALEKGRMVMRWQVASRHFNNEHKYATLARRMRISILKGEDAETIRARLNEEEERTRAAADYTGLACAQCCKHGNTVTLRSHLLKEHGIDKSSVKDNIAVRIDSNSVQKQFYAWPPRKEVKLENPVQT
ncbi:hypothetical protein JR316_0003122 [Psilocybe cubensis]|uniref:F-box domain-containing protein n=2 Tax=Psilocybe cubensis TaxID=181762 RepID=A0A8H8CMU6_PSICU|nr:hypothetical protein JR316_0003122 [Psilocybe cubensis]KAH9483652.1 hypothetical protein JR316_0003122 [Psilocybe cubensis]